MPNETIKPLMRVFDPIDRMSEILLGLIMVLVCTGSLNVAQATTATNALTTKPRVAPGIPRNTEAGQEPRETP